MVFDLEVHHLADLCEYRRSFARVELALARLSLLGVARVTFFTQTSLYLSAGYCMQILFMRPGACPPRYFVENAGKLIQVPKDFKNFEQLTKNFQ